MKTEQLWKLQFPHCQLQSLARLCPISLCALAAVLSSSHLLLVSARISRLSKMQLSESSKPGSPATECWRPACSAALVPGAFKTTGTFAALRLLLECCFILTSRWQGSLSQSTVLLGTNALWPLLVSTVQSSVTAHLFPS